MDPGNSPVKTETQSVADRLKGWALPLLFFAVSWFHFTRDNHFPYVYHSDEPGKVAQIAKGEWNLRHPPLLLLSTKAASLIFGPPTSSQAIAVLGRGVSAFFAAGAVAGLVLLAQSAFGWLAGVLAGLLATSYAQLFELAHYFKEDTALLFGFVLLWLAMGRAARRPGDGSALALGAAAAVATSAKYVGILALVFALAMEAQSRWALQPRRLWRGQLLLVGAFLVSVVVLNVPLLADTGLFSNALKTEMVSISNGEGGLAKISPVTGYLNSLPAMLGWPVFVAGILGLVLNVFVPREYCRLPRLLSLFPVVYFAIVACSPKTSSRYVLPVTVCLAFFAAVLPGIMAAFAQRRFVRWPVSLRLAFPVLLGIGLVATHVANIIPTMRGFRRDARMELIAFLNALHRPDIKLVAERRIGLDIEIDGKERLKPYQVQIKECAADLGSVSELRAQGVHYIITHGATRHMFTSPGFAPQAAVRADHARRRAFYEQLDRECRIVWKTRKSRVSYLSPDLRVYSLTEEPPTDGSKP